MLLLPYRVEPAWIGKNDAESVDLYYGPDPDKAEAARVGAVWHPSTIAYFENRAAVFPPHKYVQASGKRIPVCFDASGTWRFDPVATVAFLLSGWQEVVLKTRDEHGRFPFAASFQAETDARLIPIVDWVRHITADALIKGGLLLERKAFGDKEWAFCATHDVDYIRKWRPGIWKRELLDRAILNQAKESGAKRFDRARRAVWSVFESGDPFYAALTRIPAELEGRRARGTFFYKAGAHGFRDVDYSLTDTSVLTAIDRQRRGGHEIGLHPSYHAHAHPARFSQERSALRNVSGNSVTTNRAHYLRFDYPSSIHHLESAGMTLDSTLGWAGEGGFRFGTCMPFPLFDPIAGRESEVWEVPLISMESALFNRQNLSLEDAIAETHRMMDTCRAFGGVFTGLWHNTLWDEADYPGWGAHFEDAITYASKHDARMDTLSRVLDIWK